MYLRFVRPNQLGGNISRGSLYTVHFEPNEKGGYNEHPSLISDAYEIASGADYPPALIYQAEVRRVNGHMRLSFGRGGRRSLLHLIDCDARERFFTELLGTLRLRGLSFTFKIFLMTKKEIPKQCSTDGHRQSDRAKLFTLKGEGLFVFRLLTFD